MLGKVENAFNQLIKKHSSFRTSFHLIDQKPVQKIQKNLKIKLSVEQEKEENIQKLVNAFPTSFDLSKAPLLHVAMYILDHKKTLILIDAHHIIVDGTSLNNFIQELYKKSSIVMGKNYNLCIQRKNFLKIAEKY